MTVGDGRIVDAHHRKHEVGGAGEERLARRLGLGDAEGPLDQAQPFAVEQRDQAEPGDAVQDAGVGLARHHLAGTGDDPGIARGAFGHLAVAVDLPRLIGAGLLRLLLAERVGQQRYRFDVGPRPADVGYGNDADAFLDEARMGAAMAARRHDDARSRALWESEVARRGAAADLQVDDAVAHAVAADDLAHHRLERRLAHRPGDAQLAERASQPLQMRRLVDQRAAAAGDDLVDGTGELEAPSLP